MTIDNFSSILHEVCKHHNELVIVPGGTIGRLVGMVDGHDDYYYIINNQHRIMRPDLSGAKPQTYWSCVGGLTYLKPGLSEEAYTQLDRDAESNGAVKVAEVLMIRED